MLCNNKQACVSIWSKTNKTAYLQFECLDLKIQHNKLLSLIKCAILCNDVGHIAGCPNRYKNYTEDFIALCFYFAVIYSGFGVCMCVCI